LLIGRFGVYHHIGISIWELTQICGRLCTEQGLHCGDSETGNLLQDQRTRRIFWQVYIIDRYSSIALDRPFAIDDVSIEVGLPVDADDADLASASPSIHTLDTFSQCMRPTKHTDVTVFLFCVRLRRLSSRIHAKLSTLRQDPSLHTQPYLAVGRICAALNSLLQELDAWHESAPTIPNPRCLYESPEWFTLLFCREKIDLLRRAVDLIPKANGAPPRHVLSIFLRAALTVIKTYSTMSERKTFITYTRNYFHMMFTAGLSVMYCTSVSPHLGQAELFEVSQGLQTCETTLVWMSEQLSDARSYTAVFDALHRHIAKKIHRAVGHVSAADAQPTIADVNISTIAEVGAVEMPSSFERPLGTSEFAQEHRNASSMPAMTMDSGAQGIADSSWQNVQLGVFDPPANMFNSSGPGVDNGTMQYGGLGEPISADDDLLHWAFLHDESVWNMDMMLGEYVYGDPVHSGPLDGVDM
jgi:hypothetical protein